MALGRLPRDIGNAIVSAADEIIGGQLRDQFVVDVYQAGAGTSHNMNANEVIANRAGGAARQPTRRLHACAPQRPRQHGPVHERRLSGGDAAGAASRRRSTRAPRRERWLRRCDAKSRAFADVLKVGRTHLQDAVPITLGQEFSGYASSIARGADDVERAATQLLELNLGATAVGTGLNAGDDYMTARDRVPGAGNGQASACRRQTASA